MKKLIHNSLICVAIYFALVQAANAIELLSVQTRSSPGNKAQLLLEFSAPPPKPTGFSISDPNRIIFDFVDTSNRLPAALTSQKISLGVMTGFNFVESKGTTRLIIDALSIVPYQIDIDRNKLVITLDNDIRPQAEVVDGNYTISSIDFRRGEDGEGRLLVDFVGDSVPIDFTDNNKQIKVIFRGATISDSLLRRFDVKDFGTNMDQITVKNDDNGIVMNIATHGDYDVISYQLDKQFIVEVRPLSAQDLSQLKSQKFRFTGEKISLNFQDIEVRAVLQLIADFTGLNVIISDTVQGSVTLRLENIPWDQALDFILTSKGLSKRESGNVLLIAPAEEIAAREQAELETQQQVESLAPLISEYVQINYAKASDMVLMIKSADTNLLSSRGQVSVDDRTNTLLIKDTADNIASIKDLLDHLDVPVRQVMIEAQIVHTTDILRDALGLKMGGAATAQLGKYTLGVAPTMELAREFADDPASKNTTANDLFFDFAAASVNSVVGLALAHLPGGTLLDLELQAAELEDTSKIIARPKLLTLDQQQASIETGQDIPYSTVSETGATPTTTFKSAVLKLDVTPQITPNDKITMAITITQDTPIGTGAEPSISTTGLTTNVLVDNGETIVLGGIFKLTDSIGVRTVPYLSRIPIIGRLFNASGHNVERTEILIFITPRLAKLSDEG